MPSKWVLPWQPNPGNSVNTQILTELSQCAESLNGSKGGRWKSVLTYYRPMLRDQSVPAEYPRDFLGLILNEQPDRYYFIVRGQRIVVEADSMIQLIMEKLQSFKSRVQLFFELEYLPISSIEKSRRLMEEFISIWQETVTKKSLPGHFIQIDSNFTEYGLTDYYTAQHTAVQYANVMTHLIASARN